MKIMAKGNRFPSLSGLADTGNDHFKYLFAFYPPDDDVVQHPGSVYAS